MKAARRLGMRLGLLALALTLAACTGGGAGTIEVSDAWVRSSAMMDRAGAAYMVIANEGSQDDQLLRASSDAAAVVELHESREMNGMMEMSPVTAIPVPAGGEAELAPGGLHIMLIDLTRELRPGDEVTLTLTFEKAGEITVRAVVRES
jgi:copper(I)-binding protein